MIASSAIRRPALGAMRLSTEADRDDDRAIAALQAAFDAGITMVDTADVYCWNDTEIGHNERLIARALATWHGDRSTITVATKGGMTRPDGRWEPDGRAKHLMAACERSCVALGVNQIALYQLHLPDPRVPFTTSVRALAALQRAGLVREIGLCNVTVGQIEQARRIADIASIQVELSLWNESSILSGVVDCCIQQRRPLIAYRPLGGRKSASRRNGDHLLIEVAERHGATPSEVALAWLADLSDLIVPIPGITRAATAKSAARAVSIRLTNDDRALLDQRLPAGRAIRDRAGAPAVAVTRPGEVVMIMGLPGAGKSRLAQQFVADGYVRLNRDEAGGSLRGLLSDLDRALDGDRPRVVLDNTYVTRKSRAEVIRAARAKGLAARCVWLTTSVDEAQVNAVTRLIERYGHLPDAAELAQLRTQDVAAFAPTVQFRYQRELEPPDEREGFSRVDHVPFTREAVPGYTNRAVIVWLDDPSIGDRLAATLREYQQRGLKLLGLSWQPGIEAGTTSRSEVDARFAVARERSGLGIDIEYCPHAGGPPRCWCRKPLPGLGVLLIHRHQLAASQCVYIGGGSLDPGYARKLGFSWTAAP